MGLTLISRQSDKHHTNKDYLPVSSLLLYTGSLILVFTPLTSFVRIPNHLVDAARMRTHTYLKVMCIQNTHVCTYVRLHVCICMYVCVYGGVCMYVCMYVGPIYVCICMCVCM